MGHMPAWWTTGRASVGNADRRIVHDRPHQRDTVRLVDKTTGKAVPDAVIFATRLDMAPDLQGLSSSNGSVGN